MKLRKMDNGGGGPRSFAIFAALLGGIASLGLLIPAPALAQDSIEGAARAFAGAWASGSVERITPLLSGSGIRLQLDGGPHGPLSPRQASVALRDFLRGYQGGGAVVTRAAPVDGSRDRGFAEIRWISRVAGTSQELRRDVFLGMKFEDDRWRVDEVRLLR
jgi:hypothetical protein